MPVTGGPTRRVLARRTRPVDWRATGGSLVWLESARGSGEREARQVHAERLVHLRLSDGSLTVWHDPPPAATLGHLLGGRWYWVQPADRGFGLALPLWTADLDGSGARPVTDVDGRTPARVVPPVVSLDIMRGCVVAARGARGQWALCQLVRAAGGTRLQQTCALPTGWTWHLIGRDTTYAYLRAHPVPQTGVRLWLDRLLRRKRTEMLCRVRLT